MAHSLRLLGGAQIELDGSPVRGRAAHRRRLALLALLSAAKQSTLPREKLIAQLWPEHPEDAARHLLSESLYVLRKELGEGALVALGDTVRLDTAVVSCDVASFEAACDAHDFEHAVALYSGPFLDGWYVEGAPEFERWAESQRDRLARRYAAAVEQLAQTREAVQDWHGAAGLWRDLLAADPYSSRVTRQLIIALDRAGEHGAALQFASAHRAAMKEEFGVDADADVLALIDKIRAENAMIAAPGALEGRQPPNASGVPSVPSMSEVLRPPASASGVAPNRRAGMKRQAWVAVAAASIATGALGMSITHAFDTAAPATKYDPRTIAVLFFADDSPNHDLGYLASGLTQSLITELSAVKAIHVLPREAVRQYRDRTVSFDSLVSALRVGSVVEGSVQRSSNRIRVRVQLTSPGTNRTVSTTIEHADTDLFELEDDVTRQLETLLRRGLGESLRLQSATRGTANVSAREDVLRAEEILDDAAQVATHEHPLDTRSAVSMLERADSLFAAAETADPKWLEPLLGRGRVTIGLSRLAYGAERDSILRAGLENAERAVSRAPHDAAALEIRGTVFWRMATALGSFADRSALVAKAGADLHAAVTEDASRASAWATLSQYLMYQGNVAEADVAAKRALAEDAYLGNAADIHDQLYRSALLAGDLRSARAWCSKGGALFGTDWRFVECQLSIMLVDTGIAPNPTAAWALVGELGRIDPVDQARVAGHPFSPIYRLMAAAAISARSGQHDSAQAVIARARRFVQHDSVMNVDLDYDEAYVRMALGEEDKAVQLLDHYLTKRPSLSAYVIDRDPLFARIRDRLRQRIRRE